MVPILLPHPMPGNYSPTDPLPLFYREYGYPNSSSPPLVLIHGLFGCGTNWHSLATRQLQIMAENRRILVPDLRNHGQSSHHGTMTYEAMAADLAALLDQLGIAQVDLVGHSLGGKAAMVLALQWPQRVRTLVVEDIAPVTYSVRFQGVFAAMHDLDLGDLTSRKDAERRLAGGIPNPSMRGLILQNLRKTETGWNWRINLAAISGAMDNLRRFPDCGDHYFDGPTYFVHGEHSDYVSRGQLPQILALFPQAQIKAIPNAGHWIHADQLEAFAQVLRELIPT